MRFLVSVTVAQPQFARSILPSAQCTHTTVAYTPPGHTCFTVRAAYNSSNRLDTIAGAHTHLHFCQLFALAQ